MAAAYLLSVKIDQIAAVAQRFPKCSAEIYPVAGAIRLKPSGRDALNGEPESFDDLFRFADLFS